MNRTHILRNIAILLTFALLLTGCSAASDKEQTQEDSAKETQEETQKETITVGTGGTYYPFCFQENGKEQGIEIDIWNAIGKELDCDIEFVVSGFSGLFGLLDTGKVDVIAHQLNATPEREAKYIFSEPYIYSKIKFAVAADRDDINGINELDGKTVGVGGDTEKEYIESAAPDKNIDIIVYGDGVNVLTELELGRVDAILQSEPSTLADIKKKGLDLKVVGEPLVVEVNSYPIAKENTQLKEKVDKAIKALHENGTLSEITEKWLGADISKE